MYVLSNLHVFWFFFASTVGIENVTNANIAGCTFATNFAEDEGGSLLAASVDVVRVVNCSFTGDRSDFIGGSIFFGNTGINSPQNASVISSSFTNVSAPEDGAISAFEYRSVNIESSDFVNCTGRDAASMYSHL